MQQIKIIFPHQLFSVNPVFSFDGPVYLVEEWLFFKQYNFHKQKIAFHRATMKYYERFLIENGHDVRYIQSTEPESDVRVLITLLHDSGFDALVMVDPVDNWLLKRVSSVCRQLGIELTILDSPMFLNTSEDLSQFFSPTKKKYFQTEFYKQQRIKRNLLMDERGGPIGGQWTYDEENRKKFPKGKDAVEVVFPEQNSFAIEAQAYARAHYADNIGEFAAAFNYPIGFEASDLWLAQFLETRFAEFGDYEDAIVGKELLLNHSLLAPMLNVGMLTPDRVIDRAMDCGLKTKVPMNSLEGFVRQIMGWREFIRGVYIAKGSDERTRNYWGFQRKIPASFYNGSTGILPVDECIKKVIKTGYCHHIERLMVLGNFMLLCEFDPDEVYRWFMEMFIDSYDWVMVPNVYGMSQFADGGLMSTKPYVSGSNYLMKMSDYPKGPWQETWDALFWRFLDTHRDFFLRNPRLSMLVKAFDKWDDSKKNSTNQRAELYLASLG